MKSYKRPGKYIKFCIYLVAIVLVNIVGMTLFFRVDLTESGMYSISDASKEVVATLNEPLTIKVFFTKNLPAPHNNTERYLNDLLEEYAIAGNRFFNYRFYDVSPEGEGGISGEAASNRELAENYGIYPLQIQQVENDQVQFKKAYMGLVLIHGDMIEKIPAITSTDGLEYKLTTSIRKLNDKISALLALEENISIRMYLSSSLERVAPYMGLDLLRDLPREVKSIVEGAGARNYDRIDYSFVDPTRDGSALAEIEKYNIMTLRWPALSKGQIAAGEGAIGLVMTYGEKALSIPLLNVIKIPIIGTQYELMDMVTLDEVINENVATLIDVNEKIGYLASHGAPSLSGPPPGNPMMQQQVGMSSFNTLVSSNYSIKNVALDEGGIPDGFKTLIIANPKEKFTDWELFQIDQALMRGQNLAIFLDAFDEVMPQQQFGFGGGPSYNPIDTGLEDLLAHYGVRIRPSYVLDESCYKQRLPQHMGGGEREIYFAPVIKNEFIDQELGFMKNIKGLVAMKVSPLELEEDAVEKNGIDARKLFASSEKGWEMEGRIELDPRRIFPPKSEEAMESFPLAYLLEGEFPSYFAGKTAPERVVKEEEKQGDEAAAAETPDPDRVADLASIEKAQAVIEKGSPARIFVMASSEMLKDNMLDAEGRSPNATFLMNVIDALNDRGEVAEMRSKVQRFNPLMETSPLVKNVVKAFDIVVVPLLVVLFGFFVWIRRRWRRKSIRMRFNR